MPAAQALPQWRSSRALQWLGAHPVTARSLLTLRPDAEDTMGRARSDMGYALLGDMVAHAAEDPSTPMRRAILRPLNISAPATRPMSAC